jgi:hypothetical protein
MPVPVDAPVVAATLVEVEVVEVAPAFVFPPAPVVAALVEDTVVLGFSWVGQSLPLISGASDPHAADIAKAPTNTTPGRAQFPVFFRMI